MSLNLKSLLVKSIIQTKSKSPPGIAKAVAMVSTPGTKFTIIIYSMIRKLPRIPNHEFILLNTFAFSMTIDMIKTATFGMKIQ